MGPWRVFEAEVDAVISERASEYDLATMANVREFGVAMKSAGCAVPFVDPGYWPTFRLTWGNAPGAENLEIEVFEDRFEVYRFFDGRTDIRYEFRSPGEVFPDGLLQELPPSPADPPRDTFNP
jgi:hypothetical protein